MFVEEYLRQLRESRFTPGAVILYVRRCARRSLEAAHDRPLAMRGVVIAGFIHLIGLFAAAVALSFFLDRALAQEFFLSTGLWLAGGLLWITLHLGMFRDDHELPHSGLGLPNFLTLGRLLTIPAFYLFITRDHEALALAAFALGGITDVADGVAARRLKTETRLGKLFDPLVDVLFNSGIAVGLTMAGYLPMWLLGLILFRYGILTLGGSWIYIYRGPVHVEPTVLGKATGVITTGLVFAVVLLHRFLDPVSSEQVLELLTIALGFVFVLATVQVVVLGVTNLRRISGRSPQSLEPGPKP